MGLFSSKTTKQNTLSDGLEKTKNSLFSKIVRAINGKSKVDDNVLDSLEETLISSDVGVETTLKIIERISFVMYILLHTKSKMKNSAS